MIGLKNRCRLFTTVLFLITVAAIGGVQFGFSQGYLPWPDFANVTPIVVDPRGDEAPNFDIISCRVTFNENYLYFELKVLGTPVPESIYIYLDTDSNSGTGDKSSFLGEHSMGAEYYVHSIDAATMYLYRFTGSAWERSKPVDFRMGENSMDIGLARVDIGSPANINVLFMTKSGTDYAPDKGFIALQLSSAVVETNWFVAYGIYTIAAVMAVVAIALVVYWRYRGTGTFQI